MGGGNSEYQPFQQNEGSTFGSNPNKIPIYQNNKNDSREVGRILRTIAIITPTPKLLKVETKVIVKIPNDLSRKASIQISMVIEIKIEIIKNILEGIRILILGCMMTSLLTLLQHLMDRIRS